MLRAIATSLSLLYSIFLLTPATQAQENLVLSGVAVYTDTARDIYLAGVHRPPGEPPSAAPVGPMAMEYRIYTRRISTRGYFGTLLLQAEMGSGERAPESVIKVIKLIKARVRGAFLRGDSIVLTRSSERNTHFNLNESELLVVPGTETFDFFLQGWLGSNASSLLRESLLADDTNIALQARFSKLLPDQERIDTVAGWLDEPASEPSEVAIIAAVVEASPAPVAPEVATNEVTVPSPEEPTVTVELTETKAEPLPEPEPAQPVIQRQLDPDAPGAITDTIDDREYQRELSQYMAKTINKVFSEVEYPRRALKRRQQGQVLLVAQVSSSGKLQEVLLQASSGHAILDQAAVKAAENAAPFPELSGAAREEFLSTTGDNGRQRATTTNSASRFHFQWPPPVGDKRWC